MLKIAICDDDKTILDYIEKLIKGSILDKCTIRKYSSANALMIDLNNIINGNLDILFLDINLVDHNGIFIAQQITHKYPHIKIIFISGCLNYGSHIFKVDPIYFLDKPIKEEKLINALQRAKQVISLETKPTIAFETKKGIINLELNNIKYISSEKRIVSIHTSNKYNEQHIVYIKLDHLENKLPNNFLRCHKSYIVNLDYVTELSRYRFSLSSGDYIDVSQVKYNECKTRFIEYISRSL